MVLISSDKASIAIISAIIVEIIILYAIKLQVNKRKKSFLDFAKAPDGWPSLPRFQALIWTIVLLFALLGITFIRIQITSIPLTTEITIPENLLALLGITLASPVISNEISKAKAKKNGTNKEETVTTKIENGKERWSSMLEEKGQPSITRFQMLAFTTVSLIIYIFILLSWLNNPELTTINQVEQLVFPDVDLALLGLMGLSQGGYQFGKWSNLNQ